MPDFRITIEVRNVSGNDIDLLAEQIVEEHGEEHDLKIGDFKIAVAQREGELWFPREEGDDEIG